VDILRDTVMGALNAALPGSTRRTIYLCDDLPGVRVLVGWWVDAIIGVSIATLACCRMILAWRRMHSRPADKPASPSSQGIFPHALPVPPHQPNQTLKRRR
jgi:hypothetical protein